MRAEAEYYAEAMADRLYWAKLLTVLRNSLISVEEKKEREFGEKTGVWIERMIPIVPQGTLSVQVDPALQAIVGSAPSAAGSAGGAAPPEKPPTRAGRRGAPAAAPAAEGDLQTVLLVCRSVNLNRVRADAHTTIAESVAEELRAQTNHFNPDGTKVVGEIVGVDLTNLTFTFNVALKLVRPVKL